MEAVLDPQPKIIVLAPADTMSIVPDAITNCSEDFRDSIRFRPHKTAEFTSSMAVLTLRREVRGLSIVWRFPPASCIRRTTRSLLQKGYC